MHLEYEEFTQCDCALLCPINPIRIAFHSYLDIICFTKIISLAPVMVLLAPPTNSNCNRCDAWIIFKFDSINWDHSFCILIVLFQKYFYKNMFRLFSLFVFRILIWITAAVVHVRPFLPLASRLLRPSSAPLVSCFDCVQLRFHRSDQSMHLYMYLVV